MSITEPDGQNWLGLGMGTGCCWGVIQEGNGFVEANGADFEVELPVAQYTSNPVLTVRVETKDGTVHLKTATIDPLPMRYGNVELSDNLVVGEGTAFDWEVNGVFLNQMDNVQRIELEIYALSLELMHDDIFFDNSTKGTDIINPMRASGRVLTTSLLGSGSLTGPRSIIENPCRSSVHRKGCVSSA